MTIKVLFSAPDIRWPEYQIALDSAFSDAAMDIDLSQNHAPADVDYIIYAPRNGPAMDFSNFPKLRAVLGLWAGVEKIVGNTSLTVPLTRMVDSNLTDGMVAWVTGHVLRYHLDLDTHIKGQTGLWTPKSQRLSKQRAIGVLGLGALGTACARALINLNFPVSGWSRTQKNIAEINCYSGSDGLENILRNSEILVLLLPLTPETENIINAQSLALMPPGARIINPGRGALIDDQALLNALATGHISHATLDVFRSEPLPADDPYWAHESVTVTPHIASETHAGTSADIIADNIRRDQSGLPMQFVVDRNAGY